MVDRSDRKVYAYRTDGSRDESSDFELDADNRWPDGITYAEATFYVVDSSDDKLYAYRTDGARDASSDFDLDVDNSNPYGIAYAGGTLYVTDSSADTVFLYSTHAPDTPDLVVSLSGNATPAPDASFRMLARVRNRGRAEAAETFLRYYRSRDADISATDTEVGTDGVPSLVAGSESFGLIGLTAPANSGTYYYGACVDAVSGESDPDNNCSTGMAVGASDDAPRPVLVDEWSLAAVNNSASGIAHAGGSLYVVDDGLNGGRVYAYRTDGGRDASSDVDLDDHNSFAIGVAHAGGSLYVVDDGLNGSRVYAYRTDGGRDALADFGLHIGNGRPQEVTHASGRLFIVDDDEKVYVYRTDGGRDAASDFVLDRDNWIPQGIAHAEGRLYVLGVSKVYAYRIGGGRDASSDFDLDAGHTWPVGIAYAEGRFYVIAGLLNNRYTPAKVYVYSSDVPADARDLVVVSPSVSDANLGAGGSFTLNVIVRNRGSLEASVTVLRYYRSTDSTISTTDAQVGTVVVDRLAAGAESTKSIALTAPSSAGTYYYGACVDSVTGESNTSNNCSDGVEVEVSEGGGTDTYCRDGDVLQSGERCDIYNTSFWFEVSGTRGCLRAGGTICAGNSIRQNGSLNGVRVKLHADRNDDNSWTIDDVDPEPSD